MPKHQTKTKNNKLTETLLCSFSLSLSIKSMRNLRSKSKYDGSDGSDGAAEWEEEDFSDTLSTFGRQQFFLFETISKSCCRCWCLFFERFNHPHLIFATDIAATTDIIVTLYYSISFSTNILQLDKNYQSGRKRVKARYLSFVWIRPACFVIYIYYSLILLVNKINTLNAHKQASERTNESIHKTTSKQNKRAPHESFGKISNGSSRSAIERYRKHCQFRFGPSCREFRNSQCRWRDPSPILQLTNKISKEIKVSRRKELFHH